MVVPRYSFRGKTGWSRTRVLQDVEEENGRLWAHWHGSTTMYSVLPVWVDTPFPSSPWFCRIPCNCEPSFLLLARYWWLCRTSNIMTVAGGETAVLSSSLACGKVRKSIWLDYGLFPVEILGRESFFAWLQNSGFNGEQVNSLMCHWRVFLGE